MDGKSDIFELKLLTTSKEIGLRRLRSYSASLGGHAQIFSSFDELYKNLCSNPNPEYSSVVLYDTTMQLSGEQLDQIRQMARLFVLDAANELRLPLLENEWDTQSWEAYLQCSLQAFFESPLIRGSMAQMCRPSAPMQLKNLLRWGYATPSGPRPAPSSMADIGLAFIKQLRLAGEPRRLVEMFCHFLSTLPAQLNVSQENLIFGADGLLVAVIAQCKPLIEISPKQILDQLRQLHMPIVALNCLNDGGYEIAALHHHLPDQQSAMMVFDKEGARRPADQTGPADPQKKVPKAG